MWHLVTGKPLFRSRNDEPVDKESYLAEIVSLLGPPPAELLTKSAISSQYWDAKGQSVSVVLPAGLLNWTRNLDRGDTNPATILRNPRNRLGRERGSHIPPVHAQSDALGARRASSSPGSLYRRLSRQMYTGKINNRLKHTTSQAHPQRMKHIV